MLVEGVGDGRGGDLADQHLDDGRSALQCHSDGVGVASDDPWWRSTGGGPRVRCVVVRDADARRAGAAPSAASGPRRCSSQTQLRRFVKDNFAETIETIDTVRDVVAGVKAVTGWQDARGEHGGKGEHGGSSYQALASAIVELDEEAEEAFRGYVERVGLSENLNTVVQLFGAYDGLIVLPGLLRGAGGCG